MPTHSLSYAKALTLYGSPRALAIALGVDASTAAKWKHKRGIPAEHEFAILFLLAPNAFPEMRDNCRAKLLRRHARALRYLQRRRPELVDSIPFDLLAAPPDET